MEVKNREILLVVILVANVFISMKLNFQEFLLGNYGNIKNVIVTFVYMVIWIFILRIVIKSKNRIIIKYCTIYWVISLIAWIVMIYADVTDNSGGLTMILAILFAPQGYGIHFIIRNYLMEEIIMAFISLAISTTTILWLKHTKSTYL